MKLLLILPILALNLKLSSALECMGCEISDASESCNFFYKCKTGVETCETIVSKINGSYSIIMACASKEKCGHDTVFSEGFEECQHKK